MIKRWVQHVLGITDSLDGIVFAGNCGARNSHFFVLFEAKGGLSTLSPWADRSPVPPGYTQFSWRITSKARLNKGLLNWCLTPAIKFYYGSFKGPLTDFCMDMVTTPALVYSLLIAACTCVSTRWTLCWYFYASQRRSASAPNIQFRVYSTAERTIWPRWLCTASALTR